MKILFVCLGNICRSPMAEGIASHRAREMGVHERIEVDSAGTSGFHSGELADRRTREVLAKHGITLDCRSRQVVMSDFKEFDKILAMDSANLNELRRRCPAEYLHKLALVLTPVGGGDVPDPYYGGPEGFDVNYRQLTQAIDAWLQTLH